MEEWKPCPACQSKPIILVNKQYIIRNKYKKLCETEYLIECAASKCKMKISTGWVSSMIEATENWNRRTNK